MMDTKLIRTELGKNFTRFVLSLKLLHLSNRTWPWKRLSQMAYITTVSAVAIILLKLSLHNVSLRSVPKSTNLSSRLLDIENFHWLMNNKSVCNKEVGTSKLMVILVHTARDHFLERKSIRETWGSLKLYKDWTTRVVFLLGDASSSSKDQLALNITNEFNEHGDIVMGNFQDTYKNLTYKHLMGYKWILEHCPEATFVWKVDDDIFIDTLSIIEWRNAELSQMGKRVGGENSPTKLIDFYCSVSAGSEPQRDPSLKWFVSQDLWPSSKYPTYCSGWAYGISVPWIRKIYSVSLSVGKAFWIDDIFVTGVLVKLVHDLHQEGPLVRNVWPYTTYMYDPFKTTFCLDKDSALSPNATKRNFGAFGRLLRGDKLVRDSRCIWANIISKRWSVIDANDPNEYHKIS